MKLVTAMSILKKESEFLNMDRERLFAFIDESPMAFSPKAVEALKVFKECQALGMIG